MFSREKRRQKKIYRKKLNGLRDDFQKAMLDPQTFGQCSSPPQPWDVLELWGGAFLIDETVALKTLTKVLMVLSIVLSALTFVLGIR